MAIRSNAKSMMEALQAQVEDWQKRKVEPGEFQYVIDMTQCYAMIEILYQLEALNGKARI